ncbi:MAG TPA: DUF4192 domain-containing protein, partial [Rugosimonospora sp.]|nr:DUF4192 domain-containing protein [Rugosimonospora sp.]
MTPTVCLSSPVDMLSAVPYMLGFHPTDSIVVLGLRDDALVFQLRGDLPKPHEVRDFATYYARVVQRQQVDAAMLAGYGEAASVTPVVFATARALVRRRITVVEAVRAHRGRFWSYLCGSPRCCPPEGKPYDVSSSRVAAQATVSGYVALPSRSDLERRLAPLSGPPRT